MPPMPLEALSVASDSLSLAWGGVREPKSISIGLPGSIASGERGRSNMSIGDGWLLTGGSPFDWGPSASCPKSTTTWLLGLSICQSKSISFGVRGLNDGDGKSINGGLRGSVIGERIMTAWSAL